MDYFATAPKGTERALRDELVELGFSGVKAERGGVHFQGPPSDGYRACLWSRVAMRVLTPVATFECADETALYDGVRTHDFSNVLTPRHTLLVSAACRSSRLTHTLYVAQRTKDAIVDRLRDEHGARPDVDRDDPDVHVFVHLVEDRATLYLDLAGKPLFLRGYRQGHGAAPLKENLAAAVLRLSGFRPELPVLDPACGSATLLIEAGLWAQNRAPGALRERFGFERWADFDETARRAMTELRQSASAGIRRELPPLLGTDIDESVLSKAQENAERAAVKVELRRARLSEARPGSEPGVCVTNPPYGERLAQSPELPRELARFVDRFPDSTVGVLMKQDEPFGRTRRKPLGHTLYNGDLPCTLRVYLPIDRNKNKP